MMPSYQVDSVHVMEKVVVSGSRDRGISVWSIHQVTIMIIICIIAIDQVIIIVIVIREPVRKKYGIFWEFFPNVGPPPPTPPIWEASVQKKI